MSAIEFKNFWPVIWGILGCLAWLSSLGFLSRCHYLAIPIFKKSKNGTKNFLLRSLYLFLVVLGLISWILISIAFSGPRIPLYTASKEILSNDIYIVLDTSRSMLANDFEPNRLEVAKKEIRNFVKGHFDNRISLITFSEKYFTQVPLTFDRDYFLAELDKISPMELGPGTNIGDSLGLTVYKAMNSMAKNKTIILLTDGVSQIESIDPVLIAEKAQKNSIPIYTIGIGADKNAQIPMHDQYGDYLSDIPGSSYDMDLLEKISSLTGGKFFQAKDGLELKNVFFEIEKKEKEMFSIYKDWAYKELKYFFMATGIGLFLIVELLRLILFRESIV